MTALIFKRCWPSKNQSHAQIYSCTLYIDRSCARTGMMVVDINGMRERTTESRKGILNSKHRGGGCDNREPTFDRFIPLSMRYISLLLIYGRNIINYFLFSRNL